MGRLRPGIVAEVTHQPPKNSQAEPGFFVDVDQKGGGDRGATLADLADLRRLDTQPARELAVVPYPENAQQHVHEVLGCVMGIVVHIQSSIGRSRRPEAASPRKNVSFKIE